MAAGDSGPGCGISILPDHAATRGVKRGDLGARRDEVHDAIDNDRRGVQVFGVVAGLEDPGRDEILDIGGVDLIESAVAPGEMGAAIVRPVGVRRAAVLGVEWRRHKQD